MLNTSGFLSTTESVDSLLLNAGGAWTIANSASIDSELNTVLQGTPRPTRIDISAISRLDTAGAWLLMRTAHAVRESGQRLDIVGSRPKYDLMMERVAASYRPCRSPFDYSNCLVQLVENLGRGTTEVVQTAVDLLAFVGHAVSTGLRLVVQPRRLRLTSIVFHLEQVGFNALPIVGLISFLIGVVLAYQGATQLRQFGADVFTVDLIAISVLRELGILLTAIIIAGRSGSAFTAQLGSMKINEEVDALQTLGLDAMDVLVLPRVIALVIALPLLAFFADIMGLFGGAVMCWAVLDIGPTVFIERLSDAVSIASFWVGIVKAPVFAILIALIGCFEGFAVSGSAESLGYRTTRSVVESIFLVIVADAMFSV
ncbi:MAG: MlaE family lipid ABC transporter permease subunit, partial [Gammaproteobacteria bacterium]|nr:MlaE family lipid ABC transporter permease subunit [Gammaproteobacteria bacterium]